MTSSTLVRPEAPVIDQPEVQIDAVVVRLSDLIREGSVVTKQAHGAYVDSTGHTCALGAAVVAGKLRRYF